MKSIAMHLFEEDHDLMIEREVAGGDVIGNVPSAEEINYAMDPLELLIHLEELAAMVKTSIEQNTPVAFKRPVLKLHR